MKKCPKCGKENIDEARFCTWCRAELPVILEKKKNDLGKNNSNCNTYSSYLCMSGRSIYAF